jgi:Reverse transcriptase (RNA-dependent DNA polymerase)/Endonuclease-reverse transcriptase
VPLTPPSLSALEVSVCQLGMTGHPPLIIASCYLSPSKRLLRSDLEALFAVGTAVVLAGDFNSKHTLWSCSSTNANGTAMSRFADELLFDLVVPLTPTHYPAVAGHSPNPLDVALLKNVTLPLRSLEAVHALDSDHRPVILQLGAVIDAIPTTKLATDWRKLEKILDAPAGPALDSIPDILSSPTDANDAIGALTSHLGSAVNQASRQVPVMDDHRMKLPDALRRLLRAKNAAIRAYDVFPSEENRCRMRALRRDVRRRIGEYRNNQWDKLLREIEPTHQAYWRLARSFKADTVVSMPPLRKPDDSIAFNDDEKSECLADSMETQCSPSTLLCDPDHIAHVDREVERLSAAPPTTSLRPTTVDEVRTLIKGLKPRSAPGADGISNKVLKVLPTQLICLLVAIFNSAMSNCIFPASWKEADVIGIHKPGKDASAPSSYRPISLLKSLGKLYERILVTRLKEFVFSNDILIDEQFGFRPRHSCVNQVHRITEHILSGFTGTRLPKGTGALFFDVAKAFDKVWHNGLLYKLYRLKIPDSLVLIIRDYLSNRSFRFRVEGTHSSPHPLRAGVPQGSVLSPLLFSLYVNDIPHTSGVHLALFADDTALYFTHRNRAHVAKKLQTAASTLGKWFRKWRIEVNPDKSAAVFFSRSNKPLPPPVRLFDRPIPWVKKVKYLGVTLDRYLSFAPHIREVRNRAYFVLGRLFHLINKRSKMSLRNKRTLYTACVRPIMTYASVVFAHVSVPKLRLLQNIQNRFLRMATGCPWYVRNIDLHRDFNLPTIRKFMKDVSRRYFDACPHNSNPLIASAADYVPAPRVSTASRRPRHVLLDSDDEITLANTNATAHTPQSQISNNTSAHRTRRTRVRRPGLRVYSRNGRFFPPSTTRRT